MLTKLFTSPNKNWMWVLGASLVLCACDNAPPASDDSKVKKGLNVLTKGSMAAAEDEAKKPKAPPPPTEQTNDEGISDIAYAYSPIGKRDPFRSLFEQLQKDQDNKVETELQKYEIDQLKLVAIVSRIATPYAMVEDPSRKGHTLSRGTLIGKNWGRISQITPECVVIKEEYRDYTGRKVTNKTSMCLPKPKELKLD